jgi:hypothetical protein
VRRLGELFEAVQGVRQRLAAGYYRMDVKSVLQISDSKVIGSPAWIRTTIA